MHPFSTRNRRRLLATGVVVAATGSGPVAAQELSLDSLLSAHAEEVVLEEGRLTGPGARAIFESASDAQFVGLLEEHNVAELARFAEALFGELHRRAGFRYMALEQGSVITEWLMESGRRGDLTATSELLRRFPHALTFATDEEIEMIVGVARRSTATHNPVWGVDQELGALHLLTRLEALGPSAEARAEVARLQAAARPYESARSGDTLYLSQVARPADFARLPALFEDAGTEAQLLIEALQRTSRIYHNWYRAAVLDEPTGYENGRERERSMKERFMEEYRRAASADGEPPRVLAKLGHWHLFRGIYRADVPTFGNFLSELAIANGKESFLISTYVIESPDPWRGISGPLAEAALPGTFTLIDLRPLRPFAHAGWIGDLSAGIENLIYRADAALIIRGGGTGSYSITRGSDAG